MLNSAMEWQVGQPVQVHQLDKGFQITACSADGPGCTVVEIGADYLILEDITAGIITRIPNYLVVSASEQPAQNEAA